MATAIDECIKLEKVLSFGIDYHMNIDDVGLDVVRDGSCRITLPTTIETNNRQIQKKKAIFVCKRNEEERS